jgi:hypothetical protein
VEKKQDYLAKVQVAVSQLQMCAITLEPEYSHCENPEIEKGVKPEWRLVKA